MTEPHLIPFRAEHLLGFLNRDGPLDEQLWLLVQKENRGPAWSVVVDGGIIACGGVVIIWKGVGAAWVVFSEQMGDHGLWLTRTPHFFSNHLVNHRKLIEVKLDPFSGEILIGHIVAALIHRLIPQNGNLNEGKGCHDEGNQAPTLSAHARHGVIREQGLHHAVCEHLNVGLIADAERIGKVLVGSVPYRVIPRKLIR